MSIAFILLLALSVYGQDCGWPEIKPILAAALMEKNENSTLAATIYGLAAFGISNLFVFDTGSTDGSQQLIADLCGNNSIALDMIEGQFVDFATSRNEMLDYATNKSDWLLLVDAGDVPIEGKASLTELVLQATSSSVSAYELEISIGDTSFWSLRLIRNDGSVRYTFPVHEYIVVPENHTFERLVSPVLTQNRTITGATSPARWIRDVKVLEQFLEKEPNHPRALFYLGNTFSSLGVCSRAIPYWERRYEDEDNGWWEEREVSAIYLVDCYITVGDSDKAWWWARKLVEHGRIEGIMTFARRAIDIDNNATRCLELTIEACAMPVADRRLFMNPREYTEFRYNLRDWCRRLVANEKQI